MSEASPPPTLFAALSAFLTALPSPEPSYCLIGGVALGAWGQVRATLDLDFLILLSDETRPQLLATLSSGGFQVDDRWAESNPMLKGVVTRLHFGPHPVDLLEPRDTHEQDVLAHRRLVEVGPVTLWVAGPEDLILLKLKAGRPLDFSDAISIVLRRGASLEREYLWSWADRLGLQSELHYILMGGSPPS